VKFRANLPPQFVWYLTNQTASHHKIVIMLCIAMVNIFDKLGNVHVYNSNNKNLFSELDYRILKCLLTPSSLQRTSLIYAFIKLRKATIDFVMFVLLFARNNSAPTGQIFMKFYV